MNHVAESDAADRQPDERLAQIAQAKGCRLEPPLAAASSSASRLDGLCIIDDRGLMLAANDAYRDRDRASMPPAQLAEEVQRQLAGLPPSELARDPSSILQMDRLDGPSGPVMLITLRPREAAPPVPQLDALTHLPDRRAIVDRAADWRRASGGVMPRFAVLFLDLDDFKVVNDRHGHAVGDEVLRQLSARWPQCVRDGDLVARYGGDEFVLLIKDAATSDEVDPIIRRVKDATRLPIVEGQTQLIVEASIGWSAPSDAQWTIDALIAAADRDMYARKGRVLR